MFDTPQLRTRTEIAVQQFLYDRARAILQSNPDIPIEKIAAEMGDAVREFWASRGVSVKTCRVVAREYRTREEG